VLVAVVEVVLPLRPLVLEALVVAGLAVLIL
jgi:hypothetical protein